MYVRAHGCRKETKAGKLSTKEAYLSRPFHIILQCFAQLRGPRACVIGGEAAFPPQVTPGILQLHEARATQLCHGERQGKARQGKARQGKARGVTVERGRERKEGMSVYQLNLAPNMVYNSRKRTSDGKYVRHAYPGRHKRATPSALLARPQLHPCRP